MASSSGSSSGQSPVLPNAASAPPPPMTVTEQLMYSTVRLSNQVGNAVRWGTGFVFNMFANQAGGVPVIVTNRHVVDGWKSCDFKFATKTASGQPDFTKHINVTIGDLDKMVMFHPDVDLAIIPIGPILQNASQKGQFPFFVQLDPALIPTKAEYDALMPVEQVLTVGFPGQLWDDVHSLPVFHRGYTATAPYIDFKGKREFLIDIATWPGASGSPLLLFNEGSWMDRSGTTNMGGVRVKLLGVVYGVGVQDISGNVRIQNGPTQVQLPGQMSVPTNLGACINASRILEFEPMLAAQGIAPPAGYIMRAK